jgi:hypothetical protein
MNSTTVLNRLVAVHNACFFFGRLSTLLNDGNHGNRAASFDVSNSVATADHACDRFVSVTIHLLGVIYTHEAGETTSGVQMIGSPRTSNLSLTRAAGQVLEAFEHPTTIVDMGPPRSLTPQRRACRSPKVQSAHAFAGSSCLTVFPVT